MWIVEFGVWFWKIECHDVIVLLYPAVIGVKRHITAGYKMSCRLDKCVTIG